MLVDPISHPFIRYQVSCTSAKNKRSAKDFEIFRKLKLNRIKNNSVTTTPVKPSKKLVKVDNEMESDLKKLYELAAIAQ